MGRTVILLGATGLTGRQTAGGLLADERCGRLVAPVRRDLELEHPKLETVRLQADAPRLAGVAGATLAICLGTTIRAAGSRERFREIDFDLPLVYARAAREAGAERCVLVSSVGASTASPNFYLRVKGELEEALAGIGFSSLDLLRPSFLLGRREPPRTAERAAGGLARVFAPLLMGSLSIYRPVEASAVARAVISAALMEPCREGRRVWHWREIMGCGANSGT